MENTKAEPKEITGIDSVKEGSKVKHKAWGVGTVVQVKGSGEQTEATIVFETQGIKKVMLSYAPVEIL